MHPEHLINFVDRMGEALYDIISDGSVISLSSVEDGYEKLGTHMTIKKI
ncbi:MAG: hypothetical protein QGH75_13690 [Pseudomonadales bacterium]|jgi:hypothetical protein|nr:hypothetical protein [Pseudomonadales bacterium]HJN52842.1 hypothetical protein [Pseudomonadales bacterium]|tara:strand:- start:1182 stop:1328 length:147 start_codon:yes stop_codon:yes gene_type:complete